MQQFEQLEPAMRAYLGARDAYADAERRGAGSAETAALADVLIAARVMLAQGLARVGFTPSVELQEAIRRDQFLVEEPMGAVAQTIVPLQQPMSARD